MQNAKFSPKPQHGFKLLSPALHRKDLLGTCSLVSALTVVLLEVGSAPANAAVLESWKFDPAANQLEVSVKDGTTPRYFLLAQPLRIVLDLPDTQVGTVTAQQSYSGPIRQVRVSQFQPDMTRIVMELSPEVVLAPGQAKLQQVSSGRWVLRPAIAATVSTPAPPPAISTPNPATQPSGKQLPAKVPASSPAVTNPLDTTASPVSSSPASTQTALTPSTATPKVPGIVTELPPATFRANQTATVQVPVLDQVKAAGVIQPTSKPSSNTTAFTPPSPTARINRDIVLPPANPSQAALINSEIPTALPPAIFSPNQTTIVRVPPPTSTAVSASTGRPNPADALSFSVGVTSNSASISLPSQPTSLSTPQQPVIEFGQPLPEVRPEATTQSLPSSQSSLPPLEPGAIVLPVETPTAPVGTATGSSFNSSSPATVSLNPPSEQTAFNPGDRSFDFQASSSEITPTRSGLPTNVLLPTGTQLKLRYSGSTSLALATNASRQEVLLLQEAIRDRTGKIAVPAQTPVIGRFVTTSGGSRFVTQAIALSGRNIPLVAQSDLLGGSRQVSQDQIIRNSALGALAGALISGFSGGEVAGGAAAGATVTYLTAPKPTTLQPGQILQIRLTTDLRQP